jgi:hypothetical protein
MHRQAHGGRHIRRLRAALKHSYDRFHRFQPDEHGPQGHISSRGPLEVYVMVEPGPARVLEAPPEEGFGPEAVLWAVSVVRQRDTTH